MPRSMPSPLRRLASHSPTADTSSCLRRPGGHRGAAHIAPAHRPRARRRGRVRGSSRPVRRSAARSWRRSRPGACGRQAEVGVEAARVAVDAYPLAVGNGCHGKGSPEWLTTGRQNERHVPRASRKSCHRVVLARAYCQVRRALSKRAIAGSACASYRYRPSPPTYRRRPACGSRRCTPVPTC
ncbi:hypothetical protein D9M72_285310 [compost metagenome]